MSLSSILESTFETLVVKQDFPLLVVTLNRPHVANAMNLQMVNELTTVISEVEDKAFRVLLIQGANGHFCAGGDIKDMQAAKGNKYELKSLNLAFGVMLEKVNQLKAVVICKLQGAVLGGGFGLACVSDLAVSDDSARFALPETTLGILPAQIAPFVVQRIGLTQTRRLALFGISIKAPEALNLGIIHLIESSELLEQCIVTYINKALNCAPQANALTKDLLHQVASQQIDEILDLAASNFADAVSREGLEGAKAFMEKRKPQWASKKINEIGV